MISPVWCYVFAFTLKAFMLFDWMSVLLFGYRYGDNATTKLSLQPFTLDTLWAWTTRASCYLWGNPNIPTIITLCIARAHAHEVWWACAVRARIAVTPVAFRGLHKPTFTSGHATIWTHRTLICTQGSLRDFWQEEAHRSSTDRQPYSSREPWLQAPRFKVSVAFIDRSMV